MLVKLIAESPVVWILLLVIVEVPLTTLIPIFWTPKPSQTDSLPTLEPFAEIMLLSTTKLDPLYAIPVV